MPSSLPRITGTHFYTYLRCPRAVALDMHADRDLRRPKTEAEEFILARGRNHEAEIVAELGYPEPEFDRGDFEAGARETLAMMQTGLEGIAQGVLLDGNNLGIADLLRPEPGESVFGDYHYVVGDIKSSAHARSDQVLQVAFYSKLLAKLQERAPEYGYLILKTGQEERFELRGFDAALQQVEDGVLQVRAEPDGERPFLAPGCGHCHWSEICAEELQNADDLSLLQGMTRGIRELLERAGHRTCASVAEMAIEPAARKTRLEPAVLRRLKKAAQSRASGEPLLEKRSRQEFSKPAIVHALVDAFSERVLCFGLCWPLHAEAGRDKGEPVILCPESREQEFDTFMTLVRDLPSRVPLLHYGERLPRWFAERAVDRPLAKAKVEARFVNVARRLRGAAVFPGPVFDLDDQVRLVLQRDPHRVGDAAAAAYWMRDGEGEPKLRDKMRSDLDDLSALVLQLLPDCVEAEATS